MGTKAGVTTKYDSSGGQTVATWLRLRGDDLQLRASCSNRSLMRGSDWEGLTVGIEKPGTFVLDYDFHMRVPRFEFTGGAYLLGKEMKIAYRHQPLTRDAVVLEGMLSPTPNSKSKVNGSFTFPNHNGQMKLSYVGNGGMTSVEPSVDFANRSWGVGVAHRVYGNHEIRGSYDDHSKCFGLVYSKDSCCRIAATLPLDDPKNARLLMEKTWTYEFK